MDGSCNPAREPGAAGHGEVVPGVWGPQNGTRLVKATRSMHHHVVNFQDWLWVDLTRRSGTRSQRLRQWGPSPPPPPLPPTASSTNSYSVLSGGLPQIRGYQSTSNDPDVEQAITSLSQGWSGQPPLFISIYLTSWTFSPTDVVTIAGTLDSNHIVVRGDHFISLFRMANGLTPWAGQRSDERRPWTKVRAT